jgi:GTPase SAR1 family protein
MTSNVKKLVTIGDAQVGKSSLLYRLVHKQTPNINSATIGAAFYCTELKNHRLNMWDTAGQERFRSMVPVYLRDTDVILFVYDMSDIKSFEHLRDYWVDFALRHSCKDGHSKPNHAMSMPQLPKRSISYIDNRRIEVNEKLHVVSSYCVNEDGPLCIIVANKCDLSTNMVPNSDGIELAKKIGGSFMETSAKMGTNTENLLKYVEDKLAGSVENVYVTNASSNGGLVMLNDAKDYIADHFVSPVTNCNC